MYVCTLLATSGYKCSMSWVPQYIGNYFTKNISTCVDYKVLGTTGCKEDRFVVDTLCRSVRVCGASILHVLDATCVFCFCTHVSYTCDTSVTHSCRLSGG